MFWAGRRMMEGRIGEKDDEEIRKKRRKGQLEAGRRIEERFGALLLLNKWEKGGNAIVEAGPFLEKVRKKKGRPSKEIPGSERISLWLPKSYTEYLRKLEMKGAAKRRRVVGMGTRMKRILDRYQILEKREREQLKIIQRYIGVMDEELKKYLGRFKRSGFEDELERIMANLKEALKNLEFLMGIFRIDVTELKEMIGKREWEIFDLGYAVVKNYQEKLPSSH